MIKFESTDQNRNINKKLDVKCSKKAIDLRNQSISLNQYIYVG